MKIYGYVRVSSEYQSEYRQVKELTKLKDDNGNQLIDEKNIYVDKCSGKNFDRPNYQLLKNHVLREGDELYITSVDRLGRNKKLVKQEYNELKESGIVVRILNLPTTLTKFTDESSKHIFDMANNILLEVLTTMAEEERKKIKDTQGRGIDKWLLEGKTKTGRAYGRPRNKIDMKKFDDVYDDWKADKIKAVQAMQMLNLTRSTFYRLVADKENKNRDYKQQSIVFKHEEVEVTEQQ